ncbi:MAG: phage protein Gp36 family protein [Nitrosomonas sp.]
MAYSNKEFFLNKINETELDNLTGADDNNLISAISSSDSLIDSYLTNAVVTLPLTPVPDMIKQLSYDIAIFYLHDRIQYADIPDWVRDKYDAAINFLKDIAKGVANIPGLSADKTSEAVQYTDNSDLFYRGTF